MRPTTSLICLICLSFIVVIAACGDNSPPPPATIAACDTDNAGLTLPPGFCATVFADQVGIPRQIVVSANGDVYTSLMNNGRILALRDTNGDGHADSTATFGVDGGTGLALRGNNLYAELRNHVIRYTLVAGQLLAEPNGDTIVLGMPTGGHGSRAIAVDGTGQLFVNIGSQGNNCEGTNRDPCAELETRAGIWQYDAFAINQPFSAAGRYATGIRNAVGLTVHPTTGLLWLMQHGRDNLQNFPQLFSSTDAAENPAEELFQVSRGDDFGWPYCYHDFAAGQRVLAPEYGGNRQTVGRCAGTKAAAAVFPGHWAPNGIVFYDGTAFPARYRYGAFVTFHGSWNRAPEPQAGFRVVFLPASAGGTGVSPTYETFADGFAGGVTVTDPQQALHRPSGIAQSPDGALFVTDDRAGRIYRITYRGP